MRVLICGAGKVARHLLKRLGERWQVTLLDKSEEKVNRLISESERIQKVFAGDASSPVILDDVGVGGFDYVLALTDSDKVNLAICNHALDQGVDHILARVNDQENQISFQDIGVRTVMGSVLVAKSIHHYLQDPRINVTPLGLGRMEIMEIDVGVHFRVEGKS